VKTCTGCSRHLDLSLFASDRTKSDGLQTRCKECRAQYFAAYYRRRSDELKHASAERYRSDKVRHRAAAAQWAASNPEKIVKSRLKWREKNRQDERQAARKQQALKAKTDPTYRLHRAITRSVWGGLKSRKGGKKWQTLLGFTLPDLVTHLEAHFQPGMTWENYGAWHVDHILPRASFEYDSPDCADFKRCWALDNLQPLWALENIRKGKRVAETMPSLPTGTPATS